MKKLIYFLIVAVISTNLFSCNKNEENISEKSSVSLSDSMPDDTTENQTDITLKMAIMVSHEEEYRYEKLIAPFNNAENGIFIELKNYIDYYDGSTQEGYNPAGFKTAEFQLLQTIINTDEIDIISNNSFKSSSKFEILKNKGVFADLYTFMENDPEINRNTLNSHILSLNETNGKLYTLPLRYAVSSLCGEKKYVGDKQNQTFNDFVEHWNAMPDGSTINGDSTREYVYYTVIRENLSGFVDYENATVNFNCDEFRQLLEFCSRFRYGNKQRIEHDADAPNLVQLCRIMDFDAATEYFSDSSDITVTGYPTLNGDGSYFHTIGAMYAVSAKSSPEKQQAAWQFIRSLATADSLIDNYAVANEFYENGKKYVQYDIEDGFPINNEAFEIMKSDSLNGKYVSTGIGYDGEEFSSPIPSDNEIKRLENFMDNINRWETSLDYVLKEIVEEEAFEYFADEITLDECVDRIQNRAAIWISEQS